MKKIAPSLVFSCSENTNFDLELLKRSKYSTWINNGSSKMKYSLNLVHDFAITFLNEE